jgi:hypothetical protein
MPSTQKPTTRAVWKFPIPLGPDEFTVQMPAGAVPLTVQWQHDGPQMWALVKTDEPLESRAFRIAGTGHPIEASVKGYIGTFQMTGGSLVFHIFEALP